MKSYPVMIAAFGLFLLRIPRLCWWSLRYLPADTPAGQCRRLLLLLAGMPAFLLLQLLHWVGFLLDEILFRDYRHVRVNRPVFIVGVPRSGTTLLHRTLATDPRFTTMSTWECLLAPSITERYVYTLMARPLRPLRRWLARLSPARQLQGIHEFSLTEAEEDFLVLLPVLSCFLLIVIFPRAAGIRRLAFFDRSLPAGERRVILGFYYRCLQRHLYVHGRHRRYLGKNPSFTPMLESLFESFDDAHVIGCTRPPAEAVPSQLSALRPALSWFGFSSFPPSLRDFMIEVLHFYYRQLMLLSAHHGASCSQIQMKHLRRDLENVVMTLYADMQQPLSPELVRSYREMARQARQYRSRHQYRLQEFNLDEQRLNRQFSDVWPAGAM